MEEWLTSTGGSIPDDISLAGMSPPVCFPEDDFLFDEPPKSKPVDQNARKNKRKAARKARKRRK